MARIIIQQGWFEMPVTIIKTGKTEEHREGGWHHDEEHGCLFAAFRDEAPYAAAMGWNPEVAVRNLLKMEEEQSRSPVGKTLGCCDCDEEFPSTEARETHALRTGHNVKG